MRLKIPFKGTVLDYDPFAAQIDGIGVVGDPNDPLEPIDIKLENVSWGIISIDLESGLVEIEVIPDEMIELLREGGDPDNDDDWEVRPTTEQEKQTFLALAQNKIEGKTKDELFITSNSPRPVIPEAARIKYVEKPPPKGVRD